jgi:hypothetical protein
MRANTWLSSHKFYDVLLTIYNITYDVGITENMILLERCEHIVFQDILFSKENCREFLRVAKARI